MIYSNNYDRNHKWVFKYLPIFKGFITKIIYNGQCIKLGKNFVTNTIPKIVIDKGCFLFTGNNVLIREHVEIRIHKKSKIINNR